MIILSHPTSNEFNRAAAEAFNKASLLLQFHTTVASFPGTLLGFAGSFPPFSEFRRRSFIPDLESVTHTFPWKELGRIISSKSKLDFLIKHETGFFSVDSVYRSLDRRVAEYVKRTVNGQKNIVYAYEDGALNSFKEAKKKNFQCVYDLPIGYWRTARRLLEDERRLKPEWASTLTGFRDSDLKLKRKDEELLLSDRIIVASTFTANSLKDFPGKLAPVEVIPYGFPQTVEKKNYLQTIDGRPLKLLFVGGLSQRKGIADVFAAVEALGSRVELTVVGRKTTNECSALDSALSKYRWISSLPHNEILLLMQENDVLIFPSLFEGFGLVITEAMSQGIPVITTDRTAGPDLIEHGRNGWFSQPGSSESLKEVIELLLQNPSLIKNAGKEALETARKRPWKAYGQELTLAMMNHLSMH